MSEILIRPYNKDDRQAVRGISFDTSFLGRPEEFVGDLNIVADALTMYFTDFEPESCLVAVEKGRVIGYLTGSMDGRRINRVFLTHVLPKILKQGLFKGIFFREKEWRLIRYYLISFLKGEFYIPNFLSQYPALLHINIDKHYRGRAIGRQLVEKFIKELRGRNIAGVQISTMSEGARAFFGKMEFKILYQGKRSFLKYQLSQDCPLYIMGKALVN